MQGFSACFKFTVHTLKPKPEFICRPVVDMMRPTIPGEITKKNIKACGKFGGGAASTAAERAKTAECNVGAGASAGKVKVEGKWCDKPITAADRKRAAHLLK